MARLLVPFGSCSEALELAPLVHACRAAGWHVDCAWHGTAAALEQAREVGLTDVRHHREVTANASFAERHAAASAFAADLIAATAPDVVATAAHRPFALAAGALCHHAGVPVLRVNAGQRSHASDDENERRRRAADHAAAAWCVATGLQRTELLREGLPAAAVHVVGSLLPAAFASLSAVPPAPPFVWLALLHGARASREALEGLLGDLARAAAATGVAVRAGAPGFAAALARTGLMLPAGIELAAELSPRGQLDAARSARAIVTDSAGYQELAAVARIPCLVAAAATARPETVQCGASTLVGAAGERLAEALPRALNAPAPASPYAADAAARIVAVLDELRSPRIAAVVARPAAPRLPSDADHSGRTLGDEEVALAAAAIRSGTLNSTRGTFVTEFERRFACWLGTRHAVACNSGSMAVHAALAALGLEAGDEVVTTPITDMGALTPILYEGALPVFADVDPVTKNVTAATIGRRLTDRTRAIVVTHLFGLPCAMEEILALAERRGLPVVEDCAQAFGATLGGRKVGTIGRLAAFSLQQGKHITCGEGGIVATDDDALARRLFLFVNKAWGYGDPRPDHTFPALNGRLSELQGAVALAQLPKLDGVVAARRAVAAELRERLAGVEGLRLPVDPPGGTHAFWRFAFDVDGTVLRGGAAALGKRMQAAGINCVPRYVQKPAFECALFADWRRSPVTWLPLSHNPRRDGPMPPFTREDYPGAVAALDAVVVLPINERYTSEHTAHVAAAIAEAARELHG